jgi:drug/metabolite transporter (DMT)-like permease
MLAAMVRSTWRLGVSSRLDAVPAPGLALATLMALNLMWGGPLPATKLALQSFGPFSLAAARLVLASALFLSVLGPRTVRQLPLGDALRIAVLAPVLLRERVRAATLLGLVLALAGVAIVMRVGLGQPEGPDGTPTGGVIVLLSSAAAALYTVLGKGVAQRHSPLVLCTGSCLGGALGAYHWQPGRSSRRRSRPRRWAGCCSRTWASW